MLNDMKVASVVATGTVSTGVGSILDLIPDDVGKVAVLLGAVLSVVLIYTHLRNGPLTLESTRLQNLNFDLDQKRKRLEIQLLEEELANARGDE